MGPISERERDRLRAAYAKVWDDGYKWGYDGDTDAKNPYGETTKPAPQKRSPTLEKAGPEAIALKQRWDDARRAELALGDHLLDLPEIANDAELSQAAEAALDGLANLQAVISAKLRKLVEKVTAP